MATNFSSWTKLSSQQSLNAHIQDKSNPHQTFTLEPQIDSRDVATKPSDYYESTYGELKFLGLKTKTALGLSDGAEYNSLIGLYCWHDKSGGNSHELTFNNYGIWHRSGLEDTWGNWNRLVEEPQLSNYLNINNGGTLSGKLTLQTDAWEQLDLKEKGNNDAIGRFRFSNRGNLYPELHITLSSDNSNDNRTFLSLTHYSDANSLQQHAFQIVKVYNGTYSEYKIYGEHNAYLLDKKYVRLINQEQVLPGNITIKNGYPSFYAWTTDVTIGTAPSTNIWRQPYKLLDSTGHTLGAIEFGYKTTKENRVNLICYPGTTIEANGSANVQISVGFDGNGNWFTHAPTPGDVSSNDTFIATTAYVHNKFKTSTSDLTAGSSSLATGQFYFVYE